MASKNELREELAAVRLEKRRVTEKANRDAEWAARDAAALRKEIRALRLENAAKAERESRRMRAENEAEQHRIREKERAERKAHLANLGKGVLHLEGASEHSISMDERGVRRLDVTFTLDAEEHAALDAFLRPAPAAPESPLADALHRIVGDYGLLSAGIIPTRIVTGSL